MSKFIDRFLQTIIYTKVDSSISVKSLPYWDVYGQTEIVVNWKWNDSYAIFFYKSHFKNPVKNPTSYLVEAGI